MLDLRLRHRYVEYVSLEQAERSCRFDTASDGYTGCVHRFLLYALHAVRVHTNIGRANDVHDFF